MALPYSRAEQRFARCRGELHRGSGLWPSWGISCALEPPFQPFDWRTITTWDLAIGGFEGPYQGTFSERLMRFFQPVTVPAFDRYYRSFERDANFHTVTVAHYPEDEITLPQTEQLLLALGEAHEPVGFELYSIGESTHEYAREPRIEVRFVVSESDLPLTESQLHALYPASAIVPRQHGWDEQDFEWHDRLRSSADREDPIVAVPLCLSGPYCAPVRTVLSLDSDPLGSAIAIMDELGPNEWLMIQVLFTRAKHRWAENLQAAAEDPYHPRRPIAPDINLTLLKEKIAYPLFAVNVNLVTNAPKRLVELQGWVRQYDAPTNSLQIRDTAAWRQQWADAEPPAVTLWRDVLYFREPVLPGMLLNLRELAGLVHLPSADLPAERLLRVQTRTRKPPKPVVSATHVLLGQNTHRGQVRDVAIPPDYRSEHCYIAGASGTGKSTLLLNMILQDIGAGHGVGVLDPHGDLISDVLRRIPGHRVADVILFDPTDEHYPFGLNILEAADGEHERITSETVMALERYFPTSWGPRLERILTYTIRTALDAIPGATLSDVERMLTDDGYRREVVDKTRDEEFRRFWRLQYPHFPKNAADPVLNKLSVFLLNRRVRNIICQRKSRLDFDRVLSDRTILLANLSTGLLTEKIAGMIGSFLVTKIVNAAFRRARMPERERVPWFLYIDEFQSFMNLSVGFERILAEARKYKLVLAGLANQYIGQLSPPVRQAIFGNVKNIIFFRLGVEDAHLASRELEDFTEKDILNLSRGEAIARVGPSSASFNVRCSPPPPPLPTDPTSAIVAQTRSRYARPKKEVEAELGSLADNHERLDRKLGPRNGDEPQDPSEDDLVA